MVFEEGDVEAGFAAAAHVFEREYRTATVHQGYIEPQNATAEWRSDGQLTVWCSTQGAFPVRTQVSHILQHPVSQIKVVPTEIGGGFGGKISVYLEPVAALLSRLKTLAPDAEVGTLPLNGAIAARIDLAGELDTAVTFVVEDGRISRIYAIRNPHKLGRLEEVAELRR